MTTQPDALRLAAEMDQYLYSAPAHPLCTDAAAELRRLHAECNDLAHQLNESNERNGRLKAQRDALLGAMQSIADCCDEEHAARDYASRQTEIRGIARAAIKAVEEGK